MNRCASMSLLMFSALAACSEAADGISDNGNNPADALTDTELARGELLAVRLGDALTRTIPARSALRLRFVAPSGMVQVDLESMARTHPDTRVTRADAIGWPTSWYRYNGQRVTYTVQLDHMNNYVLRVTNTTHSPLPVELAIRCAGENCIVPCGLEGSTSPFESACVDGQYVASGTSGRQTCIPGSLTEGSASCGAFGWCRPGAPDDERGLCEAFPL